MSDCCNDIDELKKYLERLEGHLDLCNHEKDEMMQEIKKLEMSVRKSAVGVEVCEKAMMPLYFSVLMNGRGIKHQVTDKQLRFILQEEIQVLKDDLLFNFEIRDKPTLEKSVWIPLGYFLVPVGIVGITLAFYWYCCRRGHRPGGRVEYGGMPAVQSMRNSRPDGRVVAGVFTATGPDQSYY
jgi:hypothetical protein